MTTLIIGLILWIIILIYNAMYSLLPTKLQEVLWIKILAIIAAIIILGIGIKKGIQEVKDYKFAYISAEDGNILRGKNFKWKIVKTYDKDTGDIIFIIEERYGDASEIIILPDQDVEYETYNAIDGIKVRFKCINKPMPNFKIEIKK